MATDWNVELNLPDLPPEITAVGIRMKTIRPGLGENSFRCRVAEIIENPFSYTIMLDTPVPLGWELLKQEWKAIEDTEITIHIPRESILLLRD